MISHQRKGKTTNPIVQTYTIGQKNMRSEPPAEYSLCPRRLQSRHRPLCSCSLHLADDPNPSKWLGSTYLHLLSPLLNAYVGSHNLQIWSCHVTQHPARSEAYHRHTGHFTTFTGHTSEHNRELQCQNNPYDIVWTIYEGTEQGRWWIIEAQIMQLPKTQTYESK